MSKEICEFHELEEEWINTLPIYQMQIISRLEERCNYKNLKANAFSKVQIDAIRQVGTNLTPIKDELAENLIRHEESITELQIRLYCPPFKF